MMPTLMRLNRLANFLVGGHAATSAFRCLWDYVAYWPVASLAAMFVIGPLLRLNQTSR